MNRWKTVQLGDIGVFQTGGTPSRNRSDFFQGIHPWVTTPALGAIYIDKSNANAFLTDEAIKNSATKIIPKKSLLIGIRVGVGKASINTVPMCTNQDIVSISNIDTSRISLEYLHKYIETKKNYFDSQKRGATIQGIRSELLKRLAIPLPPLLIQQQIAEVLNCTSTQIEKQNTQIEKLDTLLKSRFVEMFGDPVTNPIGWLIIPLEKVTKKIGSGATPKGGRDSYKENGIALIRSMNIHNNKFVYDQLAYIDDVQAKQLNNIIIEPNDVLLNITGASVARCCVVPRDVLPARVNQHVSILRVNEQICSQYLCNLLTNNSYQKKLLRIGRGGGATREAITKKQIEELTMPMPPLALQNEFAAFVHHVGKLEFVAQKAVKLMRSCVEFCYETII